VLPQIRANHLEEFMQLANANGLRHTLLVRAAGVVYFAIMTDNNDEASLDTLKKTAASIVSAARHQKGYAKLLHAPTALKNAVTTLTTGGLTKDMEKRVKQAFDPQNIFVPGRMVGGV
jgi:FAD/FMN-containing dehydrogenase